ncbi:carboxymuconolactone decarboxylase family protein [Dendrosporobacter sp. 1207_IL3150]|uniref:carboxymuconolactone decarboxylase family protein n=1 Tax=Dendrosporobacter sp. 1207_IL3150 TaxID=3084054 RepID=UPI002FDA5A09
MPRIIYSNNGASPFERLLGHNPDILEAWNELNKRFSSSLLDDEIKEQVRRTLAFCNGCEYHMAQGKAIVERSNKRLALAVDFARMVTNNHLNIRDDVFDVMKAVFTDAEIAELCAFIFFTNASHKFGATLKLKPE